MWRFSLLLFAGLCASAGAAAEWVASGFTEPVGPQPGYYSAGITHKEIAFRVKCSPENRMISLGVAATGPLAAAELGDKAAKAAKGGGAYDLLIRDTAYARKAVFVSKGAELVFTDPVAPDGKLLEELMSADQLVISNNPLRLTFPLSGSREVICEALNACGITQSGCQAKGL